MSFTPDSFTDLLAALMDRGGRLFARVSRLSFEDAVSIEFADTGFVANVDMPLRHLSLRAQVVAVLEEALMLRERDDVKYREAKARREREAALFEPHPVEL